MTDYYCTVQDVRNALTPGGVPVDEEFEDDTQGRSAADLKDWQIIDSIIEATIVIDSIVLRRYKIILAEVTEPKIGDDGETMPDETVTVTVAPNPIRTWTRTLAAWYATLTYNQARNMDERDPIELRRQQVITSLNGVADGSLTLQLPLADTQVNDSVTVVNHWDGDLFTLQDFGLGVKGSSQPQVLIPRYTGDWGGL